MAVFCTILAIIDLVLAVLSGIVWGVGKAQQVDGPAGIFLLTALIFMVNGIALFFIV